MSAPSASKRRIGGHFGAALGAATKKQKGSWRDEVENEEAADPVPAGKDGEDDESDSEAILDPGTPLPSEEEEEAPPPEPQPAEVAAQATESAAAAEAAGENQATQEAAAQEQNSTAQATTQVSGGAAEPAGKVFTLEVIVGNAVSATLRILVPGDVDPDLEERLKACEPPDGGEVNFVAPGLCGFGGHEMPEKKKEKKKAEGAGENGLPEEVLEKKAAEETAAKLPSLGTHSHAGLLTAPRIGPGLAVTLASEEALDASHRVVGIVIAGRRGFRRLRTLAPLSFEAKPRVPIFLRLPKIEEDEAARPHLFLSLEPFAESSASPFAQDPESADAPLAVEETLDLADVEISGRDVEVADLKQATFSRERQNGVIDVEEALTSLLARLEALEGLDDTLSGQRVWVQESGQRLLRILKKLH